MILRGPSEMTAEGCYLASVYNNYSYPPSLPQHFSKHTIYDLHVDVSIPKYMYM